MTKKLMTKSILAGGCLLALALLGGCASERMKADVVRFHSGFAVQQGQSMAIAPVDSALAGGLEFSTYASLLAERLARLGYKSVANGPADLVVELAYGQVTRDTSIEGGRSPVTVGVGVGGGSGSFGLGGGINFPIGKGSNQNRGMRDTQVRVRIKRSGEDKPLWEGRATSESLNVESNSLTGLMPAMLDAVLSNFPGESGKTIRYTPPKAAK
jgi:Domain of unknown function (DUF4136)